MAHSALRAALPPLRAPRSIGPRLRALPSCGPSAELWRQCGTSGGGRPSAPFWLDGAFRALADAPTPAATTKPGSGRRTLTSSDLDAWAKSSVVLGHAHSRPSREPYELSTTRILSGEGDGEVWMPDGWSSRMVSAAGLKSSDVPNQDAFSYTLLESGWIVCVACDGHGEEGDIIAERVARTLPLHLSLLLPASSAEEALSQAFRASQMTWRPR